MSLQFIQSCFFTSITFLLCFTKLSAATFSYVYLDPTGFGFNDTTPVSPIGGNSGTTIGQQRKNLLQRATAIWAQYLDSDVEIVINANFEVLGGTSNSAVLAFAGPENLFENFTDSPKPNVWYVSALANSLTGSDLDVALADVFITVNESVDSNPNVLGGSGFYYGYDDNVGSQTNLLVTLLHEIGHGLGFLSIVDDTDGSLLDDKPDSFTLLIKDLETDKLWTEMDNNERRISATNDPDLVFAGKSTTQASKRLLKPQLGSPSNSGMLLAVSNPGTLNDTYEGEAPQFSLGVPPWGLSGKVVLVDDGSGENANDACEEPLVNASAIRGHIALIDRGTCFFVDKVKRAQDAGAIAVIITNNAGDDLIAMSGTDYEIFIPCIFIGQTDGDSIKAALPGVYATLSNKNELSGTREGAVRIHAPNPIEFGSSVSHWSSGTSSDLLMKPFIADSVRPDLDLTLTAMKDIGWDVRNIPFPHLSFELWADRNILGPENTTADDPDGDSANNLMEYAFGTDPENAASKPLLVEFGIRDTSSDLFAFKYQRSSAPADIIFNLKKTGDLKIPYIQAINGLDYRQFNLTSNGDGTESVELEIESVTDRQFFNLAIEKNTQ